jgi:hypothetical protein
MHVKAITSTTLLRDGCSESFQRVSQKHNDSISNDTQSLMEQSIKVRQEEIKNNEFSAAFSTDDSKVSTCFNEVVTELGMCTFKTLP